MRVADCRFAGCTRSGGRAFAILLLGGCETHPARIIAVSDDYVNEKRWWEHYARIRVTKRANFGWHCLNLWFPPNIIIVNYSRLIILLNSFFFCIKSNNYRKKYNEIIIEIRKCIENQIFKIMTVLLASYVNYIFLYRLLYIILYNFI